MGMGELASMIESRKAGPAPHLRRQSLWPRLASSAITQTHILGLGLVHPNIYSIYSLLECMKGLAL